jgi:hypothetical protein
MSEANGLPARLQNRALRRLFLTLFLRGRSSRGLRKDRAPRSIGQKLGWTLLLYALFGLVALALLHSPVLELSVVLHSMTFLFLGMLVAASSGELLFNKEEADILMHRPVPPARLLWSKVRVLVEVSLWFAGALNLVCFVSGFFRPRGWLFVPVHAVSVTVEALFTTGCVVLVYQLCLRWFGRERFESLVTTTQVLVSTAAVLAGQLASPLLRRFHGHIDLSTRSRWLGLLPPVWFASFDDALAGEGSATSWILAGVGLAVTAALLVVVFGKLAKDYQGGLQALNETSAAPRERRRWLHAIVQAPPLRWWLRDPVTRAGFLLSCVYLLRDRDMKLRIYPALAPVIVLPAVYMFGMRMGALGVVCAGAFITLLPLTALTILQYSQHWQASDAFRWAPLAGPAALSAGARRAVLVMIAAPALVAIAALCVLLGKASSLPLLLPGVLAIPVYTLIPSLGGKGVPLVLPNEDAKAVRRGPLMVIPMLISMAVCGLGYAAWKSDWFGWFLLGESLVAIGVWVPMRALVQRARWPALD